MSKRVNTIQMYFSEQCSRIIIHIFLYAMKAYAGSDIGVFSFGSPINGSALLIILLHQVIESRTVVSQSQLFNANVSSIMQSNLKSKSLE